MVMLPPDHNPDEHLMYARTQRKLEEAENRQGSRTISTGDVVLLSGLVLALAAVIVFLVLAFL
jgi:hypothetical protein